MSTISKAFLTLILIMVLAVVSIAALGYGWEDHKIFFVFTPDKEWVRRAAEFGSLDQAGERSRDDCLSTFSSPWWFSMSPHTRGVCWERREGYAGNLKMHYSPDSRFVYVFDYST